MNFDSERTADCRVVTPHPLPKLRLLTFSKLHDHLAHTRRGRASVLIDDRPQEADDVVMAMELGEKEAFSSD